MIMNLKLLIVSILSIFSLVNSSNQLNGSYCGGIFGNNLNAKFLAFPTT